MSLTRAPGAQTRIAIDQAILDRIDEIRPQYMDRTTFINFQLDSSLTLGKPSQPAPGAPVLPLVLNKEEEEERAREELINRPPTPVPAKPPKDPYSRKAITEDLIPDDLKDNPYLDELLIDFWHVKKGTRSERAFNGLVTKLRAMTPSDQIKALQEAYNGGWATVYQPKPDTPQQGKWQQPEPEMKHPAYRDAREIIAEQEAKWKDIPSATGGRGVLEFLSES
nr:hypothetical protein [uncultured Mediterranean phage uvMED]